MDATYCLNLFTVSRTIQLIDQLSNINITVSKIQQAIRYVCVIKHSFSYFSTTTYVVGTQKNRLIETVLLSTPKHMFKLTVKKMVLPVNVRISVPMIIIMLTINIQLSVFLAKRCPELYFDRLVSVSLLTSSIFIT